MIKTIIRSTEFEDGKLFCAVEGRRIVLANCRPKAEFIEIKTPLKTGGFLKDLKMTLTLDEKTDFTRIVDDEFLSKAARFEIQTDIQQVDGVFKRVTFDRLILKEILNNEIWTFDVDLQAKYIRRILEM